MLFDANGVTGNSQGFPTPGSCGRADAMPPFTRLAIPASLLEEVLAHARRELPNECCGLLAGRSTDSVAAVAVRFTIRNDAASEREYETNARDMFDAFRAMRAGGLELLAIYHSHPMSEPVPSRRDIDRNTYGESVVHLIVGFANGEATVRGWWLAETGAREVAMEIAEF
jgi:proteasome lid subunit RPN8/RPN11